MAWLKPATKTTILPNYLSPFLVFIFIWLFISILSDKYNLAESQKLRNPIVAIIRSNFTVLAIILILIFGLKVEITSRLIVFGTIVIASSIELFFVILFYFHRKLTENNNSSSALKPTQVEFFPQKLSHEIELELPQINIENSIYTNLKDKYLADNPDLFSFVNDAHLKEGLHLSLDKIPRNQSSILDTHTLFNIENIDSESLTFFLNLHKINDIRRINKYFLAINANLKFGGYFVGCGETIRSHHEKFYSKYPNIIAFIFYYTDFIFKRIIPKLPIFKEIYFAVTKGENRIISETEILGRLYSSGFEVLDTTEINNLFYFIARKINISSPNDVPSYGLFVKMRRVGQNGEFINIYKFRTMHPFSEYLQDYIYQKYKLEKGGKFKNDPRLTGWGRILRKLFIDELPQFINVFRGEVGIVGVRALSEHYFELYPKDLKKLRTKFKPGLVPPYYVDMPETFEEILESERKYLIKRQKKPISTQFEYFFKAWWNILVRGVRSK